MTERWVCPRCFTSAEESATSCPNCGLARGGTPEPVPAGVEPAAVATPPPPTPTALPASSAGDSGRWVCTRCFTSNQADATACASCGLARGVEAAPAGAGGWVDAPLPDTAKAPGRRMPVRWIAWGAIALVVVGAGYLFSARRGDTGEIVTGGDLDVFELRAGDCFDVERDPDEVVEIETVDAVPCADPHLYEAYLVAEYPEDEVASGPAEEYTPWEQGACLNGFEPYVGISYDVSSWYANAVVPNEEAWDAGEHTLVCFLHNEEETPVSGSARGSAQ